jgi:hypothetical protein
MKGSEKKQQLVANDAENEKNLPLPLRTEGSADLIEQKSVQSSP